MHSLNSVLSTLLPIAIDRLPSTIVHIDEAVGESLARSFERLINERPVICVSWVPLEAARVLGILAACGYTRFLWFTARGELITSSRGPFSFQDLDAQAVAINERDDTACVVAFHAQAELNESGLEQISQPGRHSFVEPASDT
jgi:hypothetical protein